MKVFHYLDINFYLFGNCGELRNFFSHPVSLHYRAKFLEPLLVKFLSVLSTNFLPVLILCCYFCLCVSHPLFNAFWIKFRCSITIIDSLMLWIWFKGAKSFFIPNLPIELKPSLVPLVPIFLQHWYRLKLKLDFGNKI